MKSGGWIHRTQDRKITIERVASHRNGIAGEPFHVILFRDEENTPFLGIVFADYGKVAVLERTLLAQDKIDFFVNSWRGDEYESALRRAVADYRLAQQLLPTNKWAAGWSPSTDPALPPVERKLSLKERKVIAEQHNIDPKEVPAFVHSLRHAVVSMDNDGVTRYVFKTPEGWCTSRTPPDCRHYTIEGPDLAAQQERQSARDILGIAMGDIIVGDGRREP